MVVAVVAANVVENSSSASGDSSGIVGGAAESPSFVGGPQAAAVKYNYTVQDTTTTTTTKTTVTATITTTTESEAEHHPKDTHTVTDNQEQDIDNNNPSSDISNIANNNNNNMTDAAKGAATTTASTTGSEANTMTTKSAVSQRNVDIKIEKTNNMEAATQQLTKKVLKLDLGGKNLDEYPLKSPKSPISARLPHQTSLTSSVDVEDRKTLREALYQGIFHRHRRTIFAVGSFLRMLRSRNSQYNTIRSSSEGEDIDEQLKHHPQELEQTPGQEVTSTSTTSSSGQQRPSDSV
ncbi:probable serine/threonine-protein kinase roco11 isoform X2 [Drosophila ficusphila]|uniref:probable serine/threonine-protein kinase roco11 isoform X2 n=1 Tax=Drosophila ficusphila TaxID=30025 RepID=UPI0007E776C8|nr:probable serine/threonine-protein kinase roco11 isoform X2 [Drosophila ficusphila]